MSRRLIASLFFTVVACSAAPFVASTVFAAPPESNAENAWPPKIKRILPPVAPPVDEAQLKQAIAARDELKAAISRLPTKDLSSASHEERSAKADVEIFQKALDLAIRHNEFFDAKRDPARIEALKKVGLERAAAMTAGKAPWSEARGTIVRGFRSLLDDSVQPYGLVIPEKLDFSKTVPLYVWLHGRGDKQCDLQFIAQFLDPKSKPGPLQPDNAIVLHPFGRYCNGFKHAGEIDVLEAIEDVQRRYHIDRSRIVIAGFSMGGAGAWHLGAHYSSKWCAVHAGAGFVDTRRYQKITPDKMPPLYVQLLWGLYDVPDYRRNLLNVPVIAYSGADDAQKAAADIMEAELAKEGLELPHIIGPGVGHKYEPKALAEVQKRLAEIVAQGRKNRSSDQFSVQTKTLRYGHVGWLALTGLERHWEDARLDWERTGEKVVIKTRNVASFVCGGGYKFEVDGHNLPAAETSNNELVFFMKGRNGWKLATEEEYDGFVDGRKTQGRQGPIDDAFFTRFIVVPPEPTPNAAGIDRWAHFESQHSLNRWTELMRGDALRRPAAEVGKVEIETSNLILWGTPRSNPLIAKVLNKLPIRWTEKTVGIGDLEFDATKVVPVLIYPNPLNRDKYVVLNSGLTFREGHDGTNSQQNPKLPDWAMIDVTEPPSELFPGKVVAAGFFDEEWKFDPTRTWKE
jgi:predicted esterase